MGEIGRFDTPQSKDSLCAKFCPLDLVSFGQDYGPGASGPLLFAGKSKLLD